MVIRGQKMIPRTIQKMKKDTFEIQDVNLLNISLEQIAEALEAKLVDAEDLKTFLANICVESYSN